MARLVLALDQGTTSSRALVLDDEGRIVGAAQQGFPQVFPQPGWVEHDPAQLWSSQRDAARLALAAAGAGAGNVAGIGIANQRETSIVWDRSSGVPIANAIVWQDRRTAAACERLRAEGVEREVRERTGLLLDPYFSATKIAWLLEHVPGARDRAERGQLAFGTVDTWLLWQLTGGAVHATDPSNASRTLLFNIHALEWDDWLLDLFRVPRSLLPEVRPSSGTFGATEPRFFGEPILVGGIAGDQQAATFGQACSTPGMVKNTYGTGSFLLMNTGARAHVSRNRLLTTVGWQIGGSARQAPGGPACAVTYALEGSIFVTGAAVQWLRDQLGMIRDAAETEALASSVPDSAGVYFVPAFVGLGAPYWDSGARGAIVGLTRGAGRAHVARAALEAACYQTRAVVEAMQSDCGAPLRDLRVDGGMTANNALLQMQADLLGIPVHRPTVVETTGAGAAYLAGLAAGVWDGPGALARLWHAERTFEPRMSSDERDSAYAGWLRAVARVRTES